MKLLLLTISLICSLFLSGCNARTAEYGPPKPVIENEKSIKEVIKEEIEKETKKETKKDFVLAEREILAKLLQDIPVTLLSDDSYLLPSREFIRDKIISKYIQFLRDNKIVYNKKFDCDDFSRAFVTIANVVNDAEVTTSLHQGIAVGEVWYMKEEIVGRTAHAINIIVTADCEFIFIEPQSCELLHLTALEVKSIKLIKF